MKEANFRPKHYYVIRLFRTPNLPISIWEKLQEFPKAEYTNRMVQEAALQYKDYKINYFNID